VNGTFFATIVHVNVAEVSQHIGVTCYFAKSISWLIKTDYTAKQEGGGYSNEFDIYEIAIL